MLIHLVSFYRMIVQGLDLALLFDKGDAMTSDTASVAPSAARTQLDYSMGQKRTSLRELRPDEFDRLLSETLDKLNPRELRGFRPLKDLLSYSPGGITIGVPQDPLEVVNVPLGLPIMYSDLSTPPIELNSHTIDVSRSYLHQIITYRRFESDEETTNEKVYQSWGPRGGYPRRVERSILVLRRPNDHSGSSTNLFKIEYSFEKVPHKSEMLVTSIEAQIVPVKSFRELFGDQYAVIARDLIWEVSSLARQTLDELKGQAVAFETVKNHLDRLANAIME